MQVHIGWAEFGDDPPSRALGGYMRAPGLASPSRQTGPSRRAIAMSLDRSQVPHATPEMKTMTFIELVGGHDPR